MFEKQNNTTNVSNSATDAIMWLKRGLTFVKEFLKNVGAGEKNLTKALQVLEFLLPIVSKLKFINLERSYCAFSIFKQ